MSRGTFPRSQAGHPVALHSYPLTDITADMTIRNYLLSRAVLRGKSGDRFNKAMAAPMQFGLFDHLERVDGRSLSDQFDERIAFAVAAEAAGAYGLHVAEHHSSPLNMIPAPGVYLSSVAQATTSLQLGTMVYLLTVTTPLKLAEEICILDHLSHGRYHVGVGRGISPYELNYHHVDHEQSRDIFLDAYECLKEALTHDPFSYDGKFFRYADVPMPLRPFQKPTPPLWYASSNIQGSAWGGSQGLHFATNGPTGRAKENIDAYKAALASRGGASHPLDRFPGGAGIGVLRHIVVADTNDEAERIARPALEYHARHLNWLRRRHGEKDFSKRPDVYGNESFDSWSDQGMAIVGDPATVAAALRDQSTEMGNNYLLAYMFFGTMDAADAHRSLDLFATDVLPNLNAG